MHRRAKEYDLILQAASLKQLFCIMSEIPVFCQCSTFVKKIFSKKIAVLFILLFFIPDGTIPAQIPAIDRKKFFTDEDVIEITLTTDFRNLVTHKKKEIYQAATITFNLPDSIKLTEEIEIKARGEYRKAECYIPNIMLNFKTPRAKALTKLGRLKLVWGCDKTSYNEQLILKEYLVYKIYNLLTDKSFRVRLVRISGTDLKGKIKPFTEYAFFIEDVDDMARRNNCVETEAKVHTEATDRQQATLMALFQYMIANTDFAVPLSRNIKLIQSKGDSLSPPYAVPYDFDYCGLVNARYAIPPEELPITSVRQRLYRGFPRTMEELKFALQIIHTQHPAIDSLITNFGPLSEHNKKEMIKYLDEFFKVTVKEKDIKELFIDKARKQ